MACAFENSISDIFQRLDEISGFSLKGGLDGICGSVGSVYIFETAFQFLTFFLSEIANETVFENISPSVSSLSYI